MAHAAQTKVITKQILASNRPAEALAALFLIIGIILIFAVHWIFGLIVIVGSLFMSISFHSQFVKDRTSRFEATCQKYRAIYKPDFSDSVREFFLGISEEDAMILIQHRANDSEVKEIQINLREVLNVDLVINDFSVYKAGPIASLSAAAIGGAAFGGAGAIVGSLTSSHIGNGKIGYVGLKLRINNIDQPCIDIPFVDKSANASSPETQARFKLAEKWTNMIEVMRYRLAPPQMPSPFS